MITLQGLTPEDVEMCDIIWGMETQQQLIDWLATLDNEQSRRAWCMIQLIIAASIDEEPLEDLSQAQEVIEHIKNLPC